MARRRAYLPSCGRITVELGAPSTMCVPVQPCVDHIATTQQVHDACSVSAPLPQRIFMCSQVHVKPGAPSTYCEL
ncbi:hypothetical protein TanjilG_02790 [Lupinus angustifolius]|uniref:Uncharacterized protein n=1 Tax=Lupinus angustifolius TaxID=3871 RepID=A0A1J7IQJ0_LUPAN|nr:hypothetical protein TanjilG_02790 [Lupinus angustifolius]